MRRISKPKKNKKKRRDSINITQAEKLNSHYYSLFSHFNYIMPKTNKNIAFIFPGQGAVPETPLTNLLGPGVETSYTIFTSPRTPPLQDFTQTTIQSDESAQLGVFHLTLAMAIEALDYCQPNLITGYSSGLYAAMVASGCLTRAQGDKAIKLAYRGVQRSSRDYVMVGVVGLHFDKVLGILHNLPTQGELSLVNNKSQVIVSIRQTDLELFQNRCLADEALKIVPLPFTYPYHVAALAETSAELNDYFQSQNLPPMLVPMVAGASPEYIPRDSSRTASLVAQQLHQTVWWYKTIQCLQESGAETMVVFDPTGTLTRIIRWISRQINIIGISTMDDFNQLRVL